MKIRPLILLTSLFLSSQAVAESSVYSIHPDSQTTRSSTSQTSSVDSSTPLLKGTKLLNNQTQQVAVITGNLLVLAQQETQLKEIARDHSLQLTKYTRGSKVGVLTAPSNVDLTQLQIQLNQDPRVQQVRLETNEQRYIEH